MNSNISVPFLLLEQTVWTLQYHKLSFNLNEQWHASTFLLLEQTVWTWFKHHKFIVHINEQWHASTFSIVRTDGLNPSAAVTPTLHE